MARIVAPTNRRPMVVALPTSFPHIRGEIVVLVHAKREMMLGRATRRDTAVAKGQKRSNREVKKPKKTDAERLKGRQAATNLQTARVSSKDIPRKP
jgi:hypothetical protein